MKPCDGCGNSPERCSCVKIERRPCTICTRPLVRSEQEIIEDERGFVAAIRCKDRSACATHCATVDWKQVEREAQ